jgi:DNA-binding beta-propeller fold protein YncE
MRKLIRSKNFLIGSAFAVALAGLGVAQFALQGKAEAQGVQAPKFEVDPFWPKPLPNHWVFGMSIGVWVDNNDHIWMVHRDNTVERTILQLKNHQGLCCQPAPPVVEFDEAGNVLHAWGGKVAGAPYDWPESNHGITVDGKGNVWIGGNGGPDSQILKFTQDGKFLMQIGKSGARRKAGVAADANAEAAQAGFAANSNDPESFGRVAKIFIDNKANEAYIADGYLNHRVAVLDADTGKMKRWWGAYGQNPVDDTVQPRYTADGPHDRAHEPTFRNPVHCADISVDRLVYVCDRVNDRMQVFTPEGKFVKEMYYQTDTLTDGSVWDIAFSKDPQQKYIFMADGVAEHVVIIDRQTLTPIYTFGDGGNYAGEFHGVHSIAIDSKGNLFTTETYGGRRIQKFIYKGMGPVTAMDEGPARPKS